MLINRTAKDTKKQCPLRCFLITGNTKEIYQILSAYIDNGKLNYYTYSIQYEPLNGYKIYLPCARRSYTPYKWLSAFQLSLRAKQIYHICLRCSKLKIWLVYCVIVKEHCFLWLYCIRFRPYCQ